MLQLQQRDRPMHSFDDALLRVVLLHAYWENDLVVAQNVHDGLNSTAMLLVLVEDSGALADLCLAIRYRVDLVLKQYFLTGPRDRHVRRIPHGQISRKVAHP